MSYIYILTFLYILCVSSINYVYIYIYVISPFCIFSACRPCIIYISSYLSVYSLRVVHELGEPVRHLIGVDVRQDLVVLALSLGAGQEPLPARVRRVPRPHLTSTGDKNTR